MSGNIGTPAVPATKGKAARKEMGKVPEGTRNLLQAAERQDEDFGGEEALPRTAPCRQTPPFDAHETVCRLWKRPLNTGPVVPDYLRNAVGTRRNIPVWSQWQEPRRRLAFTFMQFGNKGGQAIQSCLIKIDKRPPVLL